MGRCVGVLHPGAMGVSLAATVRNSGNTVLWLSEGRGAATRERATKNNLDGITTMPEFCTRAEVIISVCPPHAAGEVAGLVCDNGFTGIFADVNAISPARSRAIGQRCLDAGISYVDGGIIGGPAWEPGRTWLYLCGPDSGEVAACLSAGPMETTVMGPEIGKASALKMCYAANSKGGMALLCAIVAAAEKLGVRKHLEEEWARDDAQFPRTTNERMQRVTAKAWRFAGEMSEIADTLGAAGLPREFHDAAGDVYTRMAGFKDEVSTPSLDQVIEALLRTRSS